MARPYLPQKDQYDVKELQEQERQIIQVVENILSIAEKQNIILRLTGSLAIRMQASEFKYIEYENNRWLNDIDLVVYDKDILKVQKLMTDLDWIENQGVLRLFGDKRRIFDHPSEDLHADVFINKLIFCHTIDLRGKLEQCESTVDLIYLLLGKLQIVEINRKDLIDALLLLRSFNLNDQLDIVQLVRLCSRDWGWWRTVTMNLGKLDDFIEVCLSRDNDRKDVKNKINLIREKIAAQPKSLGWKLRSKIGDRIKWYNDVEEVQRD